MSANSRSGMSRRPPNTMRPPSIRPSAAREGSNTPAHNGRTSPAESTCSMATRGSRGRSSPSHGGIKRKERDFDPETSWETNINVVVRCRGRSEREVRENSGVVVVTDGVKGKRVELSMGPSALSNKVYQFDKVFSPAADQTTIFDEVVVPILDEVLSGYNCTIFAYGQTGTGKTYTMSGDISHTQPLPDSAGIIPRVLHYLFDRLETGNAENSVKCSFIELYNEELRDLLASDESAKLKIFEDGSRRGQGVTLVQGMEESHILNPAKGIELLRQGSQKRQVAATKCNDLSSRSHTVFTVTVYLKRVSDSGEELVSAGKLNLVDLAGSENIQRSGAENKRAAEAGLINKSLLTLGRVINALVDKGSHIPYRESKLTRLLQDSLGGRTKTSIIATVSPAKSNLEETISTLDYAFRAKNIRNKPQMNQMLSKKTLLKEFALEIEKLKSELIATRQRNGVYLTNENYEQIVTESESRRILSEEQRDRIEAMETNLRNKLQELFSLTSSFNTLKKENEVTRLALEEAHGVLEKTEIVLSHTQQSLKEEAALRAAHETTEEGLAKLGEGLIKTLSMTTSDIGGLHSKLRRRSELHSINRNLWSTSQERVRETTHVVDKRLEEFQALQKRFLEDISSRVHGFVLEEFEKIQESQTHLQQRVQGFKSSESEIHELTAKARGQANCTLEDIDTFREDLKSKFGAGLGELSTAAQRISDGIVTELQSFQEKLRSSYTALSEDLGRSFDGILCLLAEQQLEARQLRNGIVEAGNRLHQADQDAQAKLLRFREEEKHKAAEERRILLSHITSLINEAGDNQEKRYGSSLTELGKKLHQATSEHMSEQTRYAAAMDGWFDAHQVLTRNAAHCRDDARKRIEKNMATADVQATSLRTNITSVHAETTQIVSGQIDSLDTQLQTLEKIIAQTRTQTENDHTGHVSALSRLGAAVQQSYADIGSQFSGTLERIQSFREDMAEGATSLRETMLVLDGSSEIRSRLEALGADIQAQALAEYVPTGDTPQRQTYSFPTALPRTEDHGRIIARLRPRSTSSSGGASPGSRKGLVFTDDTDPDDGLRPSTGSSTSTATCNNASLREIDLNTLSAPMEAPSRSQQLDSPIPHVASILDVCPLPSLKRQNSTSLSVQGDVKLPNKKQARKTVAALATLVADGRENMPITAMNFSSSVGPGGGRRLRSHAIS